MIEAILFLFIGVPIVAAPFLIVDSICRGLWRGLCAMRDSWMQAARRRREARAVAHYKREKRISSLQAARRARVVAMQRQRGQVETERRTAEAARKRASEQRRRNDARSRCEYRWSICAPYIRQQFPREDFDRFMCTFMSEQHTADEVEAHAVQLLQIIESFYEQREVKQPARRFTTLEDATAWFIEQQDRISRLPVDEQSKDEHLARLHATYAELSERILEVPQ